MILTGTLWFHKIFNADSRPVGELAQLWRRVGICELLPGLTEYEAGQIVHQVLGPVPEIAIRQILKQAGNSIRRLTRPLERSKELKEINGDRKVEGFVALAGDNSIAFQP